MPRTSKKTYIEKLEDEVKSKQSNVSLILGALIVLVAGILIFNYFNKGNPEVGTSQETSQQEKQAGSDVSPENLPGQYTVKEGDTLFMIAQKYYGEENGDK